MAEMNYATHTVKSLLENDRRERANLRNVIQGARSMARRITGYDHGEIVLDYVAREIRSYVTAVTNILLDHELIPHVKEPDQTLYNIICQLAGGALAQHVDWNLIAEAWLDEL